MNKKKILLNIYILSSLIYFTQGIESLPSLAFFLYLKEHLGFSADKVMYIGSITTLAWLVKPLWGYLCDNYFSNKIWIVLSLLGSVIISLYFGLIGFIPITLLIILLSLSNFNSAIRDVSVDGIMCIEGKDNNNCDKIQAIQWISITVAGILAAIGGGYIAQNYSYKLAFICLIPIYLIILNRVFRYKSRNTEYKEPCCGSCKWQLECSGNDNYICESYKALTIKPNFIESILSYKELFTNKPFLFACLFLFLYKYSPSFGTPLMYIERDVFKWSAQFMGILAAFVSCFEIVGAILFFRYCKKINIKKWLIISVFLGAITSLLYLYFTPQTAVIYGICFAVIGMFIHLIIMAFMAQSTIAGKEATSFALLCSISNFAGTVSNISGAFLFPKIGLAPLICLSALTSFACLPLIKKLNIK